ncbi:hypothetical protein HKX48_002538, partial [Thoreauomyces humboldtii]
PSYQQHQHHQPARSSPGIPAAAPPVSQDKVKTSPQRVTDSEVEVEVAEHASLTTTGSVPTTFHSTLDTLAAVATSLLELSGTVVIGTGTTEREARPTGKTAPLPRDRIDKRDSRKDTGKVDGDVEVRVDVCSLDVFQMLNFVQVSSADRPDKDVPFDTNLPIRSSHTPSLPVDRSRKRIMETIDLTTDGSQPQQPLKRREIGNQAPWYPVAGFQYRRTGASHGDHTMPELAARLARFEAYKGRYNTMYTDVKSDRNLRSQAANLLISYLTAERQATGPVHPLGNNPLVMSQSYQSATRLPHPLHPHSHRQEHDANTAYDHASPPSLPVPPPPPPPPLPNGNGNGPVSNVTLMPHAPPPPPPQHHQNQYQRRERRESRPPYMQSPYHTNPTTTVSDASTTPPSPAPLPQQSQPQQPPSTLWNHPHPQIHRHHQHQQQHQQQQQQQQKQAHPHHHPYAPYAHAISTSKGPSPPSTHKRPGAKRRSSPSPPPTSPSSQRRRGGGGHKTLDAGFASVPSSSVASASTDSSGSTSRLRSGLGLGRTVERPWEM